MMGNDIRSNSSYLAFISSKNEGKSFPDSALQKKVKWIPGKNHPFTDALSRNPVFAAPNHKDIIVCKISVDIEDMALTSEDKDYQEVVNTVLSRKYDGKLLRNLLSPNEWQTIPKKPSISPPIA